MNSNITEIKASDIKTNKFKVYTSYRTHKLKDGTVAVYKSCKTYNYVPRNGDGRAAQKDAQSKRTRLKNDIQMPQCGYNQSHTCVHTDQNHTQLSSLGLNT